MAFLPPDFNCLADLWRAPEVLGITPPTIEDIQCQLYFTPKGQFGIRPADYAEYNPPVYVRFAKGTNILVDDVLEIDPGDNLYYRVRWTERVHKNFPNEYFVAICEQLAGPSPPPAGDAILLETGDFILTETLFHILEE